MQQRKKYIGQNIRAYRLQHNLSIDELAAMLGLSPAFVGLIERGQRGAKLEHLIKIAEIFKIDINDLIHEKAYKRVLSENKKTIKERKIETLVHLMSHSDINHIDFVTTTARNLRKFSASIVIDDEEADDHETMMHNLQTGAMTPGFVSKGAEGDVMIHDLKKLARSAAIEDEEANDDEVMMRNLEKLSRSAVIDGETPNDDAVSYHKNKLKHT